MTDADWVSLLTPSDVVDLLVRCFESGFLAAAGVLLVVELRRWRRWIK